MSNVRTWTTVLLNYGVDNRNSFPPRTTVHANIPGLAWWSATGQYVTSDENPNLPLDFYFCPSGTVSKQYRAPWVNVNGGAMEYTVYARLTASPAAPTEPRRLDDTIDAKYKKHSVLVADVSRWNPRPTNSNNGTALHNTHTALNKPMTSYNSVAVPGLVYKNGIPTGINIGYVDGTVHWTRWEDMDFTKYWLSSGIPADYSLVSSKNY